MTSPAPAPEQTRPEDDPVPKSHPAPEQPVQAGEEEPLLGRPGDVTQSENQSLGTNLVVGTAPLAQLGVVLLVGLVWAAVFSHQLIVFSAHPILNSIAIFAVVEAIIVLQPTHTPDQKRRGTIVHASFIAVAVVTAYAALGVVEWNKQNSHMPHFESPHAILGVIIYILFIIQALVGFTQYFVPAVYGGVDNAKAIYKYHRVSGYTILLLLLVNVAFATRTYYGHKILKISTWGIIFAVALVVLGIYPRIKKQKVKLFQRSG